MCNVREGKRVRSGHRRVDISRGRRFGWICWEVCSEVRLNVEFHKLVS